MKQALTWTASQRAAIEAEGTNILASAGAGAGKTAALIERVFRLISHPDSSSSLETLLIVTFTRAAAAEMRERLAQRLRDELTGLTPDTSERMRRHLQTQLAVLPRAQISTLHSFCMTLLREYSDRVGLPPDFDLMDEEEALLLRREAIEEEIETIFDDESDGTTLRDMLNQLSPMAGTAMLADLVRRLHSFLESLADPDRWIENVLADYRSAADEGMAFDDKVLGHRVRLLTEEPVRDALEGFKRIIEGVPRSALKNKASVTLYDKTQESIAAIQEILDHLKPEEVFPDFQELLKVARKPSGKNLEVAEESIANRQAVQKPVIDACRKRLADLPQGRTLASILHDVASTRPFIELFLQRLGLRLIEYLREKHFEQRRLTFGQLERLSSQLLREHEDVRDHLRARFTHILVDEYQDVNELQAELLAAVSRPAPNGNEFVVGDVKQSIYGFRQADPTHFLKRAHVWPTYDASDPAQPGATIVLRENFRTSPPLLRELNRFFGHLFSPELGGVVYNDSHAFVPGRNEPHGNEVRLSVHFLEGNPDQSNDDLDDDAADSNEREARYVASLIRKRGEPWSDTVILLRSASGTASVLTAELRRAGIPTHTQESLGFLEQQEVLDVVALLRTVQNPYDEVSLVGCLRGPAGDWTENELALLRLADRRARLFDTIKRLAEADEETLGIKCRRFSERLRKWQHAAAREPMARFLARIENDLHLRERLSTLPNGDGRVGNLEFLARRAIQFDAFRRKGVGRFLSFLEDLLQRDEDLGQPPAVTADDNVVRIMTIHKSKGLEFDTVIVPFLGRSFNFTDSREPIVWDRDHGIGTMFLPGYRYAQNRFPASRLMMKAPMDARTRSEELRLLYVAMTRARERLMLTASRKSLGKYLDGVRERDPDNGKTSGETTASANTFLDWIVAAVHDRHEFHEFGPDRPTSNVGGDGLQFHYVEHAIGDQEPEETPDDAKIGARQMQRWRDSLGSVNQMVDRVARLSRLEKSSDVRVKVSATEAKRVWEALHNEMNPAWEPNETAKTDDGEPDWWPPSLLPEESKQQDRGRRPGTLTHRFCALVDLETIANGGLCDTELQRLTKEGFFTENEARLVRAADVDRFFRETPVGERILHTRATVRREVPFTIRVDAGELFSDHAGTVETLLFQGVVDLIFDTPGGGVGLLDFKTDWWDGTTEHFERLEAAYTPQLALYRAGIERSLGMPVEETWLHFMRPCQPVAVPPPASAEDWLRYLRAAFRTGGKVEV